MATPISNFQPSASLYSAYGAGRPAAAPALTQAPNRALGYGGGSSFQAAIGGAGAAGGAGASLQGIAQALGQLVQQLGQLVQALGGGAQAKGGGAQVGNAQVGNAQVGNAQVGNAQVGNAQVGNAQVGNAQVGNAQVGNAQVGNAQVGTGGGQYAAAAGYGAAIGNGGGAAIGTGGGAYGGGYGAGALGGAGGYGAQGARGSMPMPTDQNEFASYLQAATNGEGKQDGNLKQNRALPNTRMGTIADGGMFKAAASRDYAIQFAAEAMGQSGRTVQGMQAGAQAFGQMSPDAQTFMQVASVYKGAGKNYDNGKLKELLKAHGVAEANKKGVGDTDIETLGAVAAALNKGQISLKDITGTQGAVKDPGDYEKAIQKVTSGEFAREVQGYDSQPIGVGGGTQLAKEGGKAQGGGAQVGNAQVGNAQVGNAQVGNAAEGAQEAGGAGAIGGAGDIGAILQQIVSALAALLQQLQQLLAGYAGGGIEAQGGGAQVGNAQVGNAQVGNAQVGNAQVGNAQVGNAQVGNAQNAAVGNSSAVGTGGY